MQPYLPDATAEEKEIGEIVNWLYAQSWGAVGGPLHVITDDLNLEDRFFEEGGFMYAEIDRDFYQDITPEKEEDKVKCRRFLDLMRPLTEARREDVLTNAETMDGPY